MSAEPGTVLAVFAHPDDETLLAGALIPKLISDGWRVHLLCLAPGDNDDLAARMELAAAELGIESVSSLRFAAAGTTGPEGGQTTSPQLASAPESAVASQIAGVIASRSPEMIVTHSPSGDYGHPDHAYCHRVTLAAAAEAAPEAAVYALAWSNRLLRLNRFMESLLRARSRSISSYTTSPDRTVTESHNVSGFLGIRKRAARHYRKEISQGPLAMRLMEAAPTWLQRFVLGTAKVSRVR